MKTITLAVLLMPTVLTAAANPARLAETWVKEAHRMAKTKGIDALVAEVQSPKGRFAAETSETDPELTVYNADLTVAAVVPK